MKSSEAHEKRKAAAREHFSVFFSTALLPPLVSLMFVCFVFKLFWYTESIGLLSSHMVFLQTEWCFSLFLTYVWLDSSQITLAKKTSKTNAGKKRNLETTHKKTLKAPKHTKTCAKDTGCQSFFFFGPKKPLEPKVLIDCSNGASDYGNKPLGSGFVLLKAVVFFALKMFFLALKVDFFLFCFFLEGFRFF